MQFNWLILLFLNKNYDLILLQELIILQRNKTKQKVGAFLQQEFRLFLQRIFQLDIWNEIYKSSQYPPFWKLKTEYIVKKCFSFIFYMKY